MTDDKAIREAREYNLTAAKNILRHIKPPHHSEAVTKHDMVMAILYNTQAIDALIRYMGSTEVGHSQKVDMAAIREAGFAAGMEFAEAVKGDGIQQD
jgi:hypothetical protein